MEIYKSNDATITYNNDHQCIHQTVKNFLHSDELKRFQTKLIDFCKTNHPKKVITDSSKLKVVKTNDLNWMSNEVLPALSRSGVQYFAIIMPDNPFGEMAVKMFVETSSDITMKIFNDLPSAQQWIHHCP